MFRLNEWECVACGVAHEDLVDVPHGKAPSRFCVLWCPACETQGQHERLLSASAEYHGEKALNPHVYGGKYDTMGRAEVPLLPELPPGAPGDVDDYRQLFASPEWKEARREQKHVIGLNEQKRARARAAQRGQAINFRRDKCAGDPKVSA